MPERPLIPMSPEAEQEQLQRKRFVILLRAVLIVLLTVVVALGIVDQSTTGAGVGVVSWWWAIVMAVLAFFGLVIAVDVLTPRRKLSTISALLLGTFAGVLATGILGFVIDLFVATYIELPEDTIEYRQVTQFVLMTKVIIGLGLTYLGVTTVLQTQDDFRLVIPYVEFAKRFRGPKPLLLDTSAIIDGRVVALATTGLVQVPVVIPGFVLAELQTLADSHDKLKRQRGRRGLDIVRELQRTTDVSIEPGSVAEGAVDQMLIEMAGALPASIVTTDSALIRMAQIQKAGVIDLNAVSRSMRPVAVPGTTIELELIRRGEQPGQAVGFVEDGTMVVVEHAEHRIGEHVQLWLTGNTQTAAGQLLFARLADEASEDAPSASADEPGAQGSTDVARAPGHGEYAARTDDSGPQVRADEHAEQSSTEPTRTTTTRPPRSEEEHAARRAQRNPRRS